MNANGRGSYYTVVLKTFVSIDEQSMKTTVSRILKFVAYDPFNTTCYWDLNF